MYDTRRHWDVKNRKDLVKTNERTNDPLEWMIKTQEKKAGNGFPLKTNRPAARAPNRVEDEYIDTARLIRNSL